MKNLIIIIAFNFISTICLGQLDLENGLMAYYPFNQNTLDESGNNHDGETNSATLAQDCFGNNDSAYFFDGVDDYIEIEHSPELDFDLQETFAISLLFKADDVVSGQASADILSKWNSTHVDTSYSYGIRMTSQFSSDPGQFNAVRYDGDDIGCFNSVSVLSSEENYLDNDWHHLVFQLNTDNFLELYIDGVLSSTLEDLNICSVRSQSNLIIGNRSLSFPLRPYKGSLDEIRIYNRALNLEEIEFLRTNKVVPSIDNMLFNSVRVSPNPVEDILTISNTTDIIISELKLLDVNGKLVDTFNSSSYRMPSKSGVYILWISFVNGKEQVVKIIKY